MSAPEAAFPRVRFGPVRPTMTQVAERAGVSLKTVSRVINNEKWVSEQTAQRVLSVIAELGYEADIQAGNLRRLDGLTRSIGLLVGAIDNPFHAVLARAIEEEAISREVTVLINSLDHDAQRERKVVSGFLRRRVDGLLLTAATQSQEYLSIEQTHGTPVVFIDSIPKGIAADAVLSDSKEGAFLGANHLIERGHRRIAYIDLNEATTTLRERHEGFLAAVAAAGIPASMTPTILTELDESEAERAIAQLLRSEDPPTAIFSAHYITTVGVVRALQRADRHRSIALVGFDDLAFADLLDPGITVVAQDPRQIGIRAAELVFDRLDGKSAPPAIHRIPTTLIPRGSGEIVATA